MAKHFCRSCGTRLNRENSYKNRKTRRGYRRICKECNKKESSSQRRKNNGNRRLILKGKYRKISITFLNDAAKREFVTCRRLQCVGCRPKVGNESKVGQRVEHLIEVRDNETNELHRYYAETLCDECSGEVRFNANGFKQCATCGLLAANFTLENEMDTPRYRDVSQEELYYSHARQG